MGRSGDRERRLESAGGGFGVDEGDQLRTFAVEKFGGLGFREGFAPGLFSADDDGSVAAAHFGDPVAKKA